MKYFTPPDYAELRTAVFKDHPFKCEDCGCNLNFRAPEFEYKHPNGYRTILHGPYKHALCGECLGNRILAWFKIPVSKMKRSWEKIRFRGKCQCCGEQHILTRIIWDDWASIRFGSNSWNGHQMCKYCLSTTAKKGTVKSSVGGVKKGGGYYSMNEAGAMIDTERLF